MLSVHVSKFSQKLCKATKFSKVLTRCKKTLSERDRNLIWHPFSQEKTAPEPIPIKRGKGSYVFDESERPYLDLVSSWWVNIHGHANEEIAEAIYKQALTLEHVIFAGFTHEPAVLLCEALSEVLPSTLKRYFFSDNGSTAVEVALKMAYQYWWNRGEKERTLFLSFEGGYHGDTFGAMAVGHKSGFHEAFTPFFFDTLSVPFPATWTKDEKIELKEAEALRILERHLSEKQGKVAGIILEPLVQGAGGMRMCRHGFLERVVTMCRGYGVLIIFDEIMTGFGRTGTTFAFNQLPATCQPDFLCISKGITGGFLPLALTVTTDEIFSAFWTDSFTNAFAHGHSYTANPIVCAAAIKSLEILRRSTTAQAIQQIQAAHTQGLETLTLNSGDRIKNTRQQGTIAAFEIGGNFNFDLNLYLKKTFAKEGLLLRPLGKTLYLLPPYSTTPNEIQSAYSIISNVINNI